MKYHQQKSQLKQHIIRLYLVSACALFSSALLADSNLIGTWSGMDSDGESATFIFNHDQSAEIQFEGLPPLSSRNLANGYVQWESSVDENPTHLDVIIFIDNEERNRIRMLAKPIDPQSLKIQISRDMKTRPTSFELIDSVFQVVTTKNKRPASSKYVKLFASLNHF